MTRKKLRKISFTLVKHSDFKKETCLDSFSCNDAI